MSLRYEILGLLSYRPSTGYELTKQINSDGLFFWQAQQSQVYREITKLEQEQLIIPNEESTTNKKIFIVTDAGADALSNWLNTSDIKAAIEIKNPLVMRMFFANHADKQLIVSELEEYKLECKRMLEEIASHKDDLKELADDKMDEVFFSLNSYYGVGFYTFSIEWADKCLNILQKLITMPAT